MKKLVLIVLTMLSLNVYAATEYIVNGTFNDNPTMETTTQTGWTLTADFSNFLNHKYMEGALYDNPSTLSQTVLGALGAVTLSFDLVWRDGYETVKWNGVDVVTITSDTTNHYVFNLTAKGNDTLMFVGVANDEYNELSNVSLKAAAVPAVPEPATYAMLLLGVGMIGAIARRHKQA